MTRITNSVPLVYISRILSLNYPQEANIVESLNVQKCTIHDKNIQYVKYNNSPENCLSVQKYTISQTYVKNNDYVKLTKANDNYLSSDIKSKLAKK